MSTFASLRSTSRCSLSTVLLVFLWAGCNDGGSSGGNVTPPQPGLASTQSSSIALSQSGDFLVNVNPDKDTLSVFQPTSLAKLAELVVGGEPQSVVIRDSTAYVANARDGSVSVATLPSGPVTSFAVGKEPMALALSPNGTRLYVANSSDNSLSVIDTTTAAFAPVTTVDLSAHGSSPRAIAVTDDGDDDDADQSREDGQESLADGRQHVGYSAFPWRSAALLVMRC